MNGLLQTVKERVDAISYNKEVSIHTQPTTCKIELTGICNLECHFCNHECMSKNNDRQSILPTEDFEKILKYIKTIPSLKEIGLFYMGESSLHPKLSDFYQKLKKEGYFTYLTTNAIKIDNTLKAIPYIDSLKVSWNYKSQEDFVQNYAPKFLSENKKKILFDTIMNNINLLYEECNRYNKSLAVSTVIDTNKTDYNNILKNLKYHEHYWIPLQNQGGTKKNGKPGVLGEFDLQSAPLPCWSLFKGIYIDCNLNIRTCCYGHTDKHILGNINNPCTIKSKKDIMLLQLDGKIPNICQECLSNIAESNKGVNIKYNDNRSLLQ